MMSAQGSKGDRFVRWVRWLHKTSDPSLGEGERIVLDALGSSPIVGVLIRRHGRLVLTNRRLIFMPYQFWFVPAWPFQSSRIEISLSEIGSIRPLRILLVLPSLAWFGRFKIELKSGKSYVFQMFGADRVRTEIERLRRL